MTKFNERKFYNDSKATNIEATEKALAGFKTPVVLLAGGLDRGFTFERLVPYLKEHVSALVVFGETKELLKEAGKQAGLDQIVEAKDAIDAVPRSYCHQHVQVGINGRHLKNVAINLSKQ